MKGQGQNGLRLPALSTEIRQWRNIFQILNVNAFQAMILYSIWLKSEGGIFSGLKNLVQYVPFSKKALEDVLH